MIKKTILLLIMFQVTVSFSVTVFDTLYINKSLTQIGGSFGFSMQICAFNDSSHFNKTSAIIELNTGDNLQLHIVNNDTLEHTFTIDGLIESNNVILAGGVKDFTLNLTQIGPYRFYSKRMYGQNLGASSVIMYGYENYPKYYWNIFAQSDTLSEDIASLDVVTIPNDFQPNVFTINMKVHPELENDLHAKVVQNVGDTIYITLLNSGFMLHAFHFHGYHVEIMDASINSLYNGWIKDSFSVLEKEIVFVRLVPNHPGIYPVHEHNLITITTNGVYPGGMLNLIDIQP